MNKAQRAPKLEVTNQSLQFPQEAVLRVALLLLGFFHEATWNHVVTHLSVIMSILYKDMQWSVVNMQSGHIEQAALYVRFLPYTTYISSDGYCPLSLSSLFRFASEW